MHKRVVQHVLVSRFKSELRAKMIPDKWAQTRSQNGKGTRNVADDEKVGNRYQPQGRPWQNFDSCTTVATVPSSSTQQIKQRHKRRGPGDVGPSLKDAQRASNAPACCVGHGRLISRPIRYRVVDRMRQGPSEHFPRPCFRSSSGVRR